MKIRRFLVHIPRGHLGKAHQSRGMPSILNKPSNRVQTSRAASSNSEFHTLSRSLAPRLLGLLCPNKYRSSVPICLTVQNIPTRAKGWVPTYVQKTKRLVLHGIRTLDLTIFIYRKYKYVKEILLTYSHGGLNAYTAVGGCL